MTIVQQNMENWINNGDGVKETGEHDMGGGINLSEKDIVSLQFYNGVEQCITMEKFQNFFFLKVS